MTLTPLWTPRLDPAAPLRPLTGRYDVLVVGGGITGLTTALLLARRGMDVAVVEGRTLGSGTTGRSSAKVSLLQGTRLSTLRQRHPVDRVRAYVEGNRAAQDWVRLFCQEHHVDHQERAAATFAFGEAGARRARAEQDAATEAGLDARWVPDPDLPFATHGATWLDDQLQVDPAHLVAALTDQAREAGVTLFEHTRVRQVRGTSPVRVRSNDGEAEAGTVVVATNLPFLDRGAFFARAEPTRSYSVAFRTPTRAVDAMYLAADSPSRSLRDAPGSDGEMLLVGGNEHVTGRARSEAARLDDLRRWTDQHFAGAEETHAWSAQDYVPHHGLPWAGPVLPGRDDVLVAGGFAKWGMTNGVAAAMVLTGRLIDEPEPWAGAFSSLAEHELRGAPTAARANAEVGLAMVGGWLLPLLPGREGGAVCTHLGGRVVHNDAENSWDCPLHGSRFDADGTVLEGPATCGLRTLGA
ncbi:MAG: FAD-dependent oxidoreductase [Nocardioides sp.]|nr:FAD-dependent oxidoreductase [Nocardioides sp.]